MKVEIVEKGKVVVGRSLLEGEVFEDEQLA